MNSIQKELHLKLSHLNTEDNKLIKEMILNGFRLLSTMLDLVSEF